jgi:hypothetical protein
MTTLRDCPMMNRFDLVNTKVFAVPEAAVHSCVELLESEGKIVNSLTCTGHFLDLALSSLITREIFLFFKPFALNQTNFYIRSSMSRSNGHEINLSQSPGQLKDPSILKRLI